MKRRKPKGFGNPPEKPSDVVLFSADAYDAEALSIKTDLGMVTVDQLMPPSTELAQSLNMPTDCILMPFLLEEKYRGILFTKKNFSKAVLLDRPTPEIEQKFQADKAFTLRLVEMAQLLNSLGRWVKVKGGEA